MLLLSPERPRQSLGSASSRLKVEEEPVIKLSPEHDEFEDEGIMEKSMTKEPRVKSDTVSAAGETSPAMESQKESRKVSVSIMEPRKRTKDEEEYVPQPVRK